MWSCHAKVVRWVALPVDNFPRCPCLWGEMPPFMGRVAPVYGAKCPCLWGRANRNVPVYGERPKAACGILWITRDNRYKAWGQHVWRNGETPPRQRAATIERPCRQGDMHDGYRNTGLRPNVPVYGSKSDGLWGEMSLFMGNGIYNNQ